MSTSSATKTKTGAPVRNLLQKPAPVVAEPVVTEPVVVETVKPTKAKAKAKSKVVEAPVVPAPVEPVVVPEPEEEEVDGQSAGGEDDDGKKKRQRPRLRPFAEMFLQITADVVAAYKSLQAATRALKSLESAHTRAIHSNKVRNTSTRTPTIVFDDALVAYFRARLGKSELFVKRKQGKDEAALVVDVSDLSTETRLHRTDVTQLYNHVFKKYKMQNPDDKRHILYMNDPELMSLLTEGVDESKPKMKEEVQQLLDGTYKLTIFNIQRFTSQHLNKV